jgi:hypothetical protein
MNRERISMRTIPFPNFGVNGMPLSSDSGSYDTYLTISDVEKVTGLTGLKQVQFNPLRFLGSDLNFVASDGSKILSVEFSHASRYNTYKVFEPKNIKILLQDIGEEAFVGPDIENQVPYQLVFRQGNYAISLTAATCDAKKNMLTLEQLISIGKIVASRVAKAA